LAAAATAFFLAGEDLAAGWVRAKDAESGTRVATAAAIRREMKGKVWVRMAFWERVPIVADRHDRLRLVRGFSR